MKAAIITVQGRENYLRPLVNIIEPEVESLKLFVDYDRKGHWWNLWRCMEEMLDSAAVNEPILIMCDDVITIQGWRKYWENIHAKEGNSIYTFMSRQKHLFNAENISRGYVTKCQLRGYYDHAAIFINQQGLMSRIEKWFNETGKHTIPIKRQKWLDVVIQEYFIANNIPWTLTVPTLFNHIGNVSTFKHDIGESVMYIGNQTR